jgi:type II restriction/modification system DNA methylase subunit YeeA
VIIGNPPYQSKNKMQKEFGRAYLNRVRSRYPDAPGRADYCVYWFRRAHDQLPTGGRAGLVGTTAIRQNYSREGDLDYIVNHGGTITEAVSTQVWSGDAVVHVSIVDWIKGEQPGVKKLFRQLEDNLDSVGTPAANTNYIDTSVQGGQTYSYVNTAIDSVGAESKSSTQVRALIPSP